LSREIKSQKKKSLRFSNKEKSKIETNMQQAKSLKKSQTTELMNQNPNTQIKKILIFEIF